MKFGKSYEDAKNEGGTEGSSQFIRYFKKPTTTFRVIQNPEDWVSYWEHFNPSGHPFPCTGDRKTCPGCTSGNEKMSKASKRIAINVVENGYVNVYKFPKTLAEKLENRAQRIGTVTDRDYTIFKIQSQNPDGSTKTDYDIEGGDKISVDLSQFETLDVEKMLAAAYNESWGDSAKVETKLKADDEAKQSQVKKLVEKPAPKAQDVTYSEDELRAMGLTDLLAVCDKEGVTPPQNLVTTGEVVDWLLQQ